MAIAVSAVMDFSLRYAFTQVRGLIGGFPVVVRDRIELSTFR